MVKMLVNSGVTLRRENAEMTKLAKSANKDAPAVYERIKPQVGKVFEFTADEVTSLLGTSPECLSKPGKGDEEAPASVQASLVAPVTQPVTQGVSAATSGASAATATTSPAARAASRATTAPASGNGATSADDI